MITPKPESGAAGNVPSSYDASPAAAPVPAAKSAPVISSDTQGVTVVATSVIQDGKKLKIAPSTFTMATINSAEDAKKLINDFMVRWTAPGLNLVDVQLAFLGLLQSIKKAMRSFKRSEQEQVANAVMAAADDMLKAAKLHSNSAIAQAIGEIAGGAIELGGAVASLGKFFEAQGKANKSQQKLDLLNDRKDAIQKKQPVAGDTETEGVHVVDEKKNVSGATDTDTKIEVTKAKRENGDSKDPVANEADGIPEKTDLDASKKKDSVKEVENSVKEVENSVKEAVAPPSEKKPVVEPASPQNEATASPQDDALKYPDVPAEERARVQNLEGNELHQEIDRATAEAKRDKEDLSMLTNQGMGIYNQIFSGTGKMVTGMGRLTGAQIDVDAAELERKSKYSEAKAETGRGTKDQFADDEHDANSTEAEIKSKANELVQNTYQTQIHIANA
jgi:hypothetical protein